MANLTKNLPTLLLVFVLSITSLKFKVDKDGVQVELERTQQRLAEAETKANDFALAGVCD
jgi:hypothetical protein